MKFIQNFHFSGKLLALFMLVAPAMTSCDLFKDDGEEKPLARVKDRYLYASDVSDLIGDRVSKEDSAAIVANYVDGWINEMLVLDKAELNLKDDQKNFEKQLRSYRNSLLIYAYEKKIIQQHLDTAVSLQEIEDYYLTNQQNFLLKEDLLKVVYARVSKDAPQLDKLRRVYRSDKPAEQEEFEDYCHQFAKNFYNENEWILLGDLLKNVPLKTADPVNFIQRNEHFELQDSTSFYFVKIRDLITKDNPSPLSFEKERVRSIIINQRKLSLLKKMKLDLFNKAMAKKDFEIYE